MCYFLELFTLIEYKFSFNTLINNMNAKRLNSQEAIYHRTSFFFFRHFL